MNRRVLPEAPIPVEQAARTLLRVCEGDRACVQESLGITGQPGRRTPRRQERRLAVDELTQILRDQGIADGQGMVPRDRLVNVRHPKQDRADACFEDGEVLFANACRDLDYFDDLLEDWETPFSEGGISVPGVEPSVFEVFGVAADEVYAEPSVVLVQALVHGGFVEVVLSDEIPEPVESASRGAVGGGRQRAGNRDLEGTRIADLRGAFGTPIPSPFGTTAGGASVAMVNVVMQGTRGSERFAAEEGDRDVFVQTQTSFLQPNGTMAVGYDGVRTGTAITGWTEEECYGPGYAPDDWGDEPCQSSFTIPSTSAPPDIDLDVSMLPTDIVPGGGWTSIGPRSGGGTTPRTTTPSGRGGEVLTVGGAMVGGCEAAISDTGALKGTISNGICMGAGVAGALAAQEAYLFAGPVNALYHSTLSLGGGEVAVSDVTDFQMWMLAEGYEMGADLCNETLNEGLDITITGCQLDLLNSRDGVGNMACQTGRIRATFRLESSEDCGGGSATCEATGEQTCDWEGDCDTCTQDWDGTAMCTCN